MKINNFTDKSYNNTISELEHIFPPISTTKSRLIPFLIWSGLLAWILRVTIFVRRRPGGEFASVDVYAAFQIFIVFCLLFLLLSNKRSFVVVSKIWSKSVFILMTYYLVCAISSIWSFLPQYTLFRSFEFLVLLLATVVALSFSANFLTAERTLLLVSLIVVLLGILAQLKMTGYQTSLDKLHTNSYSASAGMIFTYCFGEYFRAKEKRKRTLKRYMFISLFGVALGTSSGSILAVLGGCCLVLFFNRNYTLVSIFTCIGIIILSLDIDLALLKQIIFYGKSEQAVRTGTGRFIMWQDYFHVFLKKPFLGFGFAVLSTAKGSVISSQPHNSLFSAALGTGIIGISFVFAFLVKVFFELIQTIMKRIPGGVGSAAAIATGFANSLSNPYLFDKWEESSLTFSCLLAFFILFVLLPYRQKIWQAKAVKNKQASRIMHA